MKKTGAKKEERFAKKAGKTWLDPMCTPFETRQITKVTILNLRERSKDHEKGKESIQGLG